MLNTFNKLTILFILFPLCLLAKEVHVGLNKEYKTISSALEHMKEEDVCIIDEGVYREKLNITLSNITLKAKGKVIVTGCDKAKNIKYITYNNYRIIKISTSKKIYDVFQNEKYLILARYPNKTAPMTSNIDWLASKIESNGTIFLNNNSLKKLSNINDGYYVGMHSKGKVLSSWCSLTLPIDSIDKKGFLHVDRNRVSSGFLGRLGIGKGYGYIIGSKVVLDNPGEWYYNKNNLFIIPLNNEKKVFEVRTRLYGLIASGNQIKIENIYFKAASAWIKGNRVTLKKCKFEYISPFSHNQNDKPINKKNQSLASCWGIPKNGTSGVFISGNYFKAIDCIFSKSWWAGMTIRGNNALIENCLFQNINWMGKRSAGIFSWGDYNKIRFCTFRNLGASAIEGGNHAWVKQYAKKNIWEYNYIDGACKLVVDQGIFYVNHQSGSNPKANSIWRYNIGKGCRGPIKGKWSKNTVGLYVDNSSSGYKIYNNIIIDTNEAIRYNDSKDGIHAGKDVIFYNNTFYKCDKLGVGVIGKGKSDADVRLVNNLFVSCTLGIFNKWKNIFKSQNNVEISRYSILKNPKKMDFTPIIGKLRTLNYNKKIPYIGGVNPYKGMWNYGAKIKEIK